MMKILFYMVFKYSAHAHVIFLASESDVDHEALKKN